MLDGRSIQQVLYTNDNWTKRRRVLFRALYWQAATCVAVLAIALGAPLLIDVSEAFVSLAGTVLTVIVPSLVLGANASVATYVFGSNQDDKNKREHIPAPTLQQAAAVTPEEFLAAVPPPGFQEGN